MLFRSYTDTNTTKPSAFTADDRHLNSAYGFAYLYADALTPDLVRRANAAWDGRTGQGWPSWAFSNHDAPRAVSGNASCRGFQRCGL